MPSLLPQLQSFLEAAQAAADPRRALRPHLDQLAHQLPEKFSLLAFGKASLEMADEALLALPSRISRGIATCVPERLASFPASRRAAFDAANIELLPADHPFATQRNLDAAARVRDFVQSIASEEHLLVLISGGGSAHLTLPAPNLSLDNLRDVTRLLQRAGRDIKELNAVRKHCEQLKGGRLAALCNANDVRVLILSDVLGDPLDVISSGPFAPDPTTYADALAVLERADGWSRALEIVKHLRKGSLGELPETPKPGDPSLHYVAATIIGGNAQLVEALAVHAASLNIAVAAQWQSISGDVASVSNRIAEFIRTLPLAKTPRVLIVGGEWTVNVGDSPGSGGPSQELALSLAIELAGTPAAALVYSTDGIDGPTDAAGAIITGDTFSIAQTAGLDPRRFLADHDSHTFFSSLPDSGAVHLKPGPTGTNINHIAVILIQPR